MPRPGTFTSNRSMWSCNRALKTRSLDLSENRNIPETPKESVTAEMVGSGIPKNSTSGKDFMK